MCDDTSPPCWLDALPLELIDHEVARRHPSIPFYLVFAYPRFARYCRQRYRLPRDPLSWFARVPPTVEPIHSAPWCVVNYAIYLPDDHPRLKRVAEITAIANRLLGDRGVSYAVWESGKDDVRYAATMIAMVPPRYDGGITCVLHSWWDDDLDLRHRDDALSPSADVVAVEQNQYDALTMRMYNAGDANHQNDADVWGDAMVVWYRYGVRHRDGDRPAVIKSIGTREWYRNGAPHRDDADLPALVSILTHVITVIEMVWCRNGVEHRDDDRPSRITARGHVTTTTTTPMTTTRLEWRQCGKLHRDGDQPSCVSTVHNRRDFTIAFYRHGKRHRDNNRASFITSKSVAWHHDDVHQHEIYIESGAPHPYAADIETWLARYLQSGDYAISTVASCPYFVAKCALACNN